MKRRKAYQVTQTPPSRYFSLLFKQNFALHYHDCFWLSTLTILPVTLTYTLRTWPESFVLPTLPFLVSKVTCSTMKATAKTFVSLSALYQPSMTISSSNPISHRYEASTAQRSKRRLCCAFNFSSSASRTSFYPHCRPIFSKQENWGQVWQSSTRSKFGIYSPRVICEL